MSRQYHILHCDDNQSDLKKVEQQLNKRKYTLKSVETIEKAKNALFSKRENNFDVLLLDLEFNNSIHEAKQFLHILKDATNILVVVLTGAGLSDYIEEEIRYLGVHGYLRKSRLYMLDAILYSILLTREQLYLSDDCFVSESIELYPSRGSVIINGEKNDLNGSLLKLLRYFALNKGHILSFSNIRVCLGRDVSDGAIRELVSRLREKLNDSNETYIETIQEIGYRLSDDFVRC